MLAYAFINALVMAANYQQVVFQRKLVGCFLVEQIAVGDEADALVPRLVARREVGRDVVVGTDQIETFTEKGIQLRSGQELEADIIETATGLKLQLLSDIEFSIDCERRDLSKCLCYKAMMFSDVPNLAYSFGYTNASWT